jgi:hypothetical protein
VAHESRAVVPPQQMTMCFLAGGNRDRVHHPIQLPSAERLPSCRRRVGGGALANGSEPKVVIWEAAPPLIPAIGRRHTGLVVFAQGQVDGMGVLRPRSTDTSETVSLHLLTLRVPSSGAFVNFFAPRDLQRRALTD